MQLLLVKWDVSLLNIIFCKLHLKDNNAFFYYRSNYIAYIFSFALCLLIFLNVCLSARKIKQNIQIHWLKL